MKDNKPEMFMWEEQMTEGKHRLLIGEVRGRRSLSRLPLCKPMKDFMIHNNLYYPVSNVWWKSGLKL